MQVEFVVGSHLCLHRFFSGYVLRFSPLLKNQHFQIPIWSWWCPQLAFCAKYCLHLNKSLIYVPQIPDISSFPLSQTWGQVPSICFSAYYTVILLWLPWTSDILKTLLTWTKSGTLWETFSIFVTANIWYQHNLNAGAHLKLRKMIWDEVHKSKMNLLCQFFLSINLARQNKNAFFGNHHTTRELCYYADILIIITLDSLWQHIHCIIIMSYISVEKLSAAIFDSWYSVQPLYFIVQIEKEIVCNLTPTLLSRAPVIRMFETKGLQCSKL